MNVHISIIIPTYNRAQYVVRAVRSALEQTYQNVEVIVVDDGSIDDTQLSLATLSDPRLRIIKQDNGGVSAARNTGIAAALGEWVAFLDDDDSWMPNKLECQLHYMQTDFTDCMASITDYKIVSDKENGVYRTSKLKNPYTK